ncbi:glycoside hydrolase family 127 protein [Echinicola jeungdonensis]|uniref:Glycoside hydrolase family 127 protein n=1 Tax=Echinicola jeungdonensis TaxID=709343 RepID=A0ABV5J7M2_9BACT|nr:glycoside hydrolase family 127 protein [Echinicola jeungdonensis]MDN3668649.1 glycoside hydrolase family 127 protein [Echinicola jeungdonensis]
MNLKYLITGIGIGLTAISANAQEKALVNTSQSPYAKLKSVDMQDVTWTGGFWGEKFKMSQENTLPFMWDLYHDAEETHAVRNFEIAAGLMKGEFDGPSFHDGDFYKIFEGMAALYAETQDPEIDAKMDKAIALIEKAQRKDGYLHTPVLIEERWGTLGEEELQKQLGFEKYNMGHLMTAACVHHRATGKDNFLNVAKGVANFLYDFYKKASPQLARNAICPSHYMGVVEMYRTTGDKRYLELAQNLIDIRGKTDDGTDDNQDRVPFRDQTEAMGHAVRANYLYAGVADLYAETGEEKLLQNLESIWDDVVHRKMYITGGCGALYDGVSPNGTSYNPTVVQKIHQAYGKPYQLPHAAAHNETCANIGNMLWNWRMLQVTGDAKYVDVLEQSLYNSVLSGVSLQGTEFFYTNPLSAKDDLPYQLRWPNVREGYISISNCCAPNVTRTLAEVNNYAYSVDEEGLYVNLYGTNHLETELLNGKKVEIKQTSEYPWDETVTLKMEKVPNKAFSLFFRIPGWCDDAALEINGEKQAIELVSGKYAEVNRKWKKGDQVKLVLEMPVKYMAANPLVEQAKGQVAIKRGPVVYCVESMDLPAGKTVDDIIIDLDEKLSPEKFNIGNSEMISLTGEVYYQKEGDWDKQLYKEISKNPYEKGAIRLVPYYSWANRGKGEMMVWLPYERD